MFESSFLKCLTATACVKILVLDYGWLEKDFVIAPNFFPQ